MSKERGERGEVSSQTDLAPPLLLCLPLLPLPFFCRLDDGETLGEKEMKSSEADPDGLPARPREFARACSKCFLFFSLSAAK